MSTRAEEGVIEAMSVRMRAARGGGATDRPVPERWKSCLWPILSRSLLALPCRLEETR